MTAAILAVGAFAAAHPLHTTMTDVAVDESRHSLRAVVRVFADDIALAARPSLSPDGYIVSLLTFTGRSGARVALASCGTRRQGDVLFVCVEGTYAGTSRDLLMSNPLLCDLYKDEVNVVQVSTATDRRGMLFTRGDGAKPMF